MCIVSVAADVPVFPTVTAVITLERYEETKSQAHLFLVPRDYHKVRRTINCQRLHTYMYIHVLYIYIFMTTYLETGTS